MRTHLKKIAAVPAAAVLAFGLAACEGDDTVVEDEPDTIVEGDDGGETGGTGGEDTDVDVDADVDAEASEEDGSGADAEADADAEGETEDEG